MRAKSLKSSQILRAHMPYFRRPSHNFNFDIPLKVIYQTKAGNQIENIVRLFFVDQMDVDKILQTVRVEVIDAKLEYILINTIQSMYIITSRFFTQMLTSV